MITNRVPAMLRHSSRKLIFLSLGNIKLISIRLDAFGYEKGETSRILCNSSPWGGLNDGDEEKDFQLGSFPALVL